MKIIVHSAIGSDAIRGSLGADDYSYYFVRESFTEALEGFAEVVAVQNPATEVDAIYDAAIADHEICVFLSFAPPHKTTLGLRCPTIPVFAWEFGTIPNEIWDEDVRNDWRAVFSVCRGAIALSSHTVRVVRQSMGEHYLIKAIPAPVFERFAHARSLAPLARPMTTIRITGTVLDTNLIEAYRKAPPWPPESVPLLTPGPIPVRGLPPPSGEPEAIVAPPPLVEESVAEEGRVQELVVEKPIILELAEPPPMAFQAQPLAAPLPMCLSLEGRPGLRRRLQISKHLALEWYRLTLRDLLPGPVRSANAFAGRTSYSLYRALFAGRSTPPVPLLVHQPVAESFIDPTPISPPEPVLEVQKAPERVAASAAPLPIVPLTRAVLPAQVTLDGVVYVSMFSPRDGRKNWFDIVTAFCWAFRDTRDATLVLKIVSRDHGYQPTLRHLLKELSPFVCRVVVLHGYLEGPDYRALIASASYYVNASHCEGLCLPMTEFMSAGTPAIAPCHTAFEDYITPNNAFVIDSGIEHNVWPGDRRDLFRTTRYRIDWHGLMMAYRESYRVAHEDPERYLTMSRSAYETMQSFCSVPPVAQALRTFMDLQSAVGLEQAA